MENLSSRQLTISSFILALLLILTVSNSMFLSSYVFINDTLEDSPGIEATAISVNEGRINGQLNKINDRADYFKIYLSRGDKITITFAKNSNVSVYLTLYDTEFSNDRYNLDLLSEHFLTSNSFTIQESRTYFIRVYIIESETEDKTVGYNIRLHLDHFIETVDMVFIVSALIALFIAIEPFDKLNKVFLSVNSLISIILFLTTLYITLEINFAILVATFSFFASQSTILWKYGFFEEKAPGSEDDVLTLHIIPKILKIVIIPIAITVISLFLIGTSFSWI
ncbi:MAG: hypothetical protein ACTSW1_00105 [Candidatus Hodarchaeales archaeon]